MSGSEAGGNSLFERQKRKLFSFFIVWLERHWLPESDYVSGRKVFTIKLGLPSRPSGTRLNKLK
jgi:hypothetical protein